MERPDLQKPLMALDHIQLHEEVENLREYIIYLEQDLAKRKRLASNHFNANGRLGGPKVGGYIQRSSKLK